MSNPFGNPAASGLSAALISDNIAAEEIHFGSDLGGHISIDLSNTGIDIDKEAVIIKLPAGGLKSILKVLDADGAILHEAGRQDNKLEFLDWDQKGAIVATIDPATTPPFTDMWFSTDGLHMYLMGSTDTLYQYDLTRPWDIRTASYASKSLNLGTEDTQPVAICFSRDGTKIYMVGSTSDLIYEYDLGTAWDLATETYNSNTYNPVPTTGANPDGIDFSPDGLTMIVYGANNDNVYQFTLGTAWDVTSANTASKNFSVGSSVTKSTCRFSPDGQYVWVIDRDTDTWAYCEIWYLPTKYDLTGASVLPTRLDTRSYTNESDFKGLCFSADGKWLYTIGGALQDVQMWEMAKIPAMISDSRINNIGPQFQRWISCVPMVDNDHLSMSGLFIDFLSGGQATFWFPDELNKGTLSFRCTGIQIMINFVTGGSHVDSFYGNHYGTYNDSTSQFGIDNTNYTTIGVKENTFAPVNLNGEAAMGITMATVGNIDLRSVKVRGYWAYN